MRKPLCLIKHLKKIFLLFFSFLFSGRPFSTGVDYFSKENFFLIGVPDYLILIPDNGGQDENSNSFLVLTVNGSNATIIVF